MAMKCRIAVASDKVDIVKAFPGIYGGFDYLQYDYDYYMASPRYICYIGEVEGQIMAYMSTRLLDDNQAYIISSERVHVDYRGRGFMKQLGVYANEYIKAYLSGPRVLRKFSYYSSEEILKKLQRHPERKIIHTTMSLGYTLTMEEIKQCLALHTQFEKNPHKALDILEMPNLTSAETKAMKTYFSNYCKAHGNSLCIYYHPFGDFDTNWDDILEFTDWAATNREALNDKDCLTNLKDMILVKWRTCELGLTYEVEIISKGDNGIEFTTEKLYTILKKMCSEQRDFNGKLSIGIVSEEPYAAAVNVTVMSLLGDKYSASPNKIYHVHEELLV